VFHPVVKEIADAFDWNIQNVHVDSKKREGEEHSYTFLSKRKM
jgi:hypothetical protein